MKIAKLVIEEQCRPMLVPSTVFQLLAALTLPFLTYVLAFWIGRNPHDSWLEIDRGDFFGLGYFARLASLHPSDGFGATRIDSVGGWLLLATLGSVAVGVVLRVVQSERARSRLIDRTVFVTMTAVLLLLSLLVSTGWTSTPAPEFADYDRLYREQLDRDRQYVVRRYGDFLAEHGRSVPQEVRAKLDAFHLEELERSASAPWSWDRQGWGRWSRF